MAFATRSKKYPTEDLGFRGTKKHRYLRGFFGAENYKKMRSTTYLTIFDHYDIEEKVTWVTTRTDNINNNNNNNSKNKTNNNSNNTVVFGLWGRKFAAFLFWMMFLKA